MKKIFNKKRSNKSNQGFSLVELMVAVALIGILTSIIITTARFSETQKNLMLAKNELQSAIRLAQSYSLSIPEQESGGAVVNNMCGFGLYVIDLGHYAVYYVHDSDLNDPNTCDDLKDPSHLTDSLEKVNLNSTKTKITIGPAGSYVFFGAPYGRVLQDGSFQLNSTGGSGSSAQITVSSSGQIN